MKKYGKYGRKGGWIEKGYGKYGRKEGKYMKNPEENKTVVRWFVRCFVICETTMNEMINKLHK